jgi:hypothetical protein
VSKKDTEVLLVYSPINLASLLFIAIVDQESVEGILYYFIRHHYVSERDTRTLEPEKDLGNYFTSENPYPGRLGMISSRAKSLSLLMAVR